MGVAGTLTRVDVLTTLATSLGLTRALLLLGPSFHVARGTYVIVEGVRGDQLVSLRSDASPGTSILDRLLGLLYLGLYRRRLSLLDTSGDHHAGRRLDPGLLSSWGNETRVRHAQVTLGQLSVVASQSFALLLEIETVLDVVDLGDKLLLEALRSVKLLIALTNQHLEVVVSFLDL